MNSQSLARGLAFFSVGLGLVELLAPKQLARAIGVDDTNENLLRVLGLREISSGLGILQGNPAGFLWSRVGGDVIDLALLGTALRSPRANRNRVLGAMAAVAGVTVLDVLAASRFSQNPAQPEWRVQRLDRSGLESEDPLAWRQYTDQMMQQHESGHLRPERVRATDYASASDYASSRSEIRSHEESATRQFEPGD